MKDFREKGFYTHCLDKKIYILLFGILFIILCSWVGVFCRLGGFIYKLGDWCLILKEVLIIRGWVLDSLRGEASFE